MGSVLVEELVGLRRGGEPVEGGLGRIDSRSEYRDK